MKLSAASESFMFSVLRHSAVLASLVVFCAAGGCSDKSGKSPKVKKVVGIAKKIDLTNNRVAMAVSDEKGNSRMLEGTVREDTEVWINGRSQRLEDVREGDKVEVSGFKEGDGENAKLVATKVIVTRPEGSDWKSTSKPTAEAPKSSPAAAAPQQPK
jgi:hypothetical protein